LDESGIEDNACRLKGWSNIGLRCYDERKYRDSLRISMMAVLNDGKIIASATLNGYCDVNVFITYITEILVKQLKKGQVLVLNNVIFHKSDKVKEAVEYVGATALFLPAYSPYLNHIEHFCFKFLLQNEKCY
jgi:putative transposase